MRLRPATCRSKGPETWICSTSAKNSRGRERLSSPSPRQYARASATALRGVRTPLPELDCGEKGWVVLTPNPHPGGGGKGPHHVRGVHPSEGVDTPPPSPSGVPENSCSTLPLRLESRRVEGEVNRWTLEVQKLQKKRMLSAPQGDTGEPGGVGIMRQQGCVGIAGRSGRGNC